MWASNGGLITGARWRRRCRLDDDAQSSSSSAEWRGVWRGGGGRASGQRWTAHPGLCLWGGRRRASPPLPPRGGEAGGRAARAASGRPGRPPGRQERPVRLARCCPTRLLLRPCDLPTGAVGGGPRTSGLRRRGTAAAPGARAAARVTRHGRGPIRLEHGAQRGAPCGPRKTRVERLRVEIVRQAADRGGIGVVEREAGDGGGEGVGAQASPRASPARWLMRHCVRERRAGPPSWHPEAASAVPSRPPAVLAAILAAVLAAALALAAARPRTEGLSAPTPHRIRQRLDARVSSTPARAPECRSFARTAWRDGPPLVADQIADERLQELGAASSAVATGAAPRRRWSSRTAGARGRRRLQ